jgi:hypothetical protein
MFDYNPFRLVKESVFRTKEEVIAHHNLVPSEDGDGYIHASGNGRKYSEEDVEYMLHHGTLKPTEISAEPEETKHIPTKRLIDRYTEMNTRKQNARK